MVGFDATFGKGLLHNVADVADNKWLACSCFAFIMSIKVLRSEAEDSGFEVSREEVWKVSICVNDGRDGGKWRPDSMLGLGSVMGPGRWPCMSAALFLSCRICACASPANSVFLELTLIHIFWLLSI